MLIIGNYYEGATLIGVSKLLMDCFAALQLPQSCPTFGIHGASSPLLPHVGVHHKSILLLTCRHDA